MTKVWAWLLLLAPLWAEASPPVLVQFHLDPPQAQVWRRATTVRGGGRQEVPLASSQGGYWLIPAECLRGDSFDLIFRAPGYKEEVRNFKKFEFRPGANRWPLAGPPLVLQAQGLRALGQFFRLHPWLSGAILLAVTGLGAFFLQQQWLLQRSRRRQRRIVALGGDPADKTIGPFIPLGLLGQGGFGQVVRAVAREQLFAAQPEVVAVKTLLHLNLDEAPPENSQEGETRRARFRREARVLERLDHPNIVRLIHYDLDGPTPYLAMECVDGENFSALIRCCPQGLPPARALELVLPVCQALIYAHAQNPPVIHRDLKPENLMLTGQGQVKVMDLGLAHSLGEKRLTKTHEWTGTPQYASPESLSGLVTPALDQFAIGLVLFELLLGRAANANASPEQAVRAVLLNQLPRLADLRPDWGEFSLVVDRMSHPDHQQRFASLVEASAALRQSCP